MYLSEQCILQKINFNSIKCPIQFLNALFLFIVILCEMLKLNVFFIVPIILTCYSFKRVDFLYNVYKINVEFKFI